MAASAIARIFAVAGAPDIELTAANRRRCAAHCEAAIEPVMSSPVVLQPATDRASDGRERGRGKQMGGAGRFRTHGNPAAGIPTAFPEQ